MTNNRVTSDKIVELEEHQIFVFGSNEFGWHGAGAAKMAVHFGAVIGVGFGMQGNTFAIPTKDWNVKTLPIEVIKFYVDRFLVFARNLPDLEFLVTAVGCGLAGYSTKDIAPLFKEAITIENIHLPKSFWDILLS